MDGINYSTGATISTLPTDLRWKLVGTGDMDRDGYADLIWQFDNNGLSGDSMVGINQMINIMKLQLQHLTEVFSRNQGRSEKHCIRRRAKSVTVTLLTAGVLVGAWNALRSPADDLPQNKEIGEAIQVVVQKLLA